MRLVSRYGTTLAANPPAPYLEILPKRSTAITRDLQQTEKAPRRVPLPSNINQNYITL